MPRALTPRHAYLYLHLQSDELVTVLRVLDKYNIRCREDLDDAPLVCEEPLTSYSYGTSPLTSRACVHVCMQCYGPCSLFPHLFFAWGVTMYLPSVHVCLHFAAFHDAASG
jgi:hypothetical protein